MKKQISLRVTNELHKWLAEQSEKVGLSINALIITILQNEKQK
jgi:predicted HicB family RNase H-like nuclease